MTIGALVLAFVGGFYFARTVFHHQNLRKLQEVQRMYEQAGAHLEEVKLLQEQAEAYEEYYRQEPMYRDLEWGPWSEADEEED